MHPALKALLHDPVTLAPYTGTDAYGKPTYGPAVSYLGRLERRYQTVLGATGRVVVEETKVFLDETAVVNTQSQLTIAGQVIPIQALTRVQDEHGTLDHIVLML